EDGIRDWSVTGVQTCALPIYHRPALRRGVVGAGKAFISRRVPRRVDEVDVEPCRVDATRRRRDERHVLQRQDPGVEARGERDLRSEERRVGKEWRGEWVRDH